MTSTDVFPETLTLIEEEESLRTKKTSPLALATFLCMALILGLVTWLTFSGDPQGGQPRLVIALTPSNDLGIGSEVISMSENGTPLPQLKPDRIDLTENADGSPWSSPDDLESLRDSKSATKKKVALRPAPDPSLIEKSATGFLPIIAADGKTALDVYARPFPTWDTRPRIAILLRGLGLSQSTTKQAIKNLPPNVTLSFVPYPENLQSWVNQARSTGHEVMLELPMEPFDYPNNDPGPFTLLTSLNASENTSRLEWLLSRVTGYVGVTNYLGAKFTITPEAISPVLETISKRGLMYLADGNAQISQVESSASETGLPWALNDQTLDYSSASAVENDLLKLEDMARQNGQAIATGFAFPVTINEINKWAQTLEQKGIVLAPISAVLKTD